MQTFSILFLNKESKLYVFVCWNQKVKVINKLPFEVCTCFVGNVKVYDNRLPAGQVILEKDVAGTYTFTLEHKQNYAVAIVGAGDGASGGTYGSGHKYSGDAGAGGAAFVGVVFLEKGTYTVVVGYFKITTA